MHKDGTTRTQKHELKNRLTLQTYGKLELLPGERTSIMLDGLTSPCTMFLAWMWARPHAIWIAASTHRYMSPPTAASAWPCKGAALSCG